MPAYEVYALRYATSLPGRTRRDNFILADLHDGDMPMDYSVWAIRGERHTVVVDTGFTREAAARRGRAFLRDPRDALRGLGVEPAEVGDVVLTHLHYDHAGDLGLFPNARFHVQDAEVAYATGRHMAHACLAGPFDVEDVVAMLEGYGRCEALAGGEDLLVPGHDPLVMRRWPAVPGCEDAVRVDLAPVGGG
jgi:glyoxylase-like metal-dependent hydrolase (beta-lactamase superfamily II)